MDRKRVLEILSAVNVRASLHGGAALDVVEATHGDYVEVTFPSILAAALYAQENGLSSAVHMARRFWHFDHMVVVAVPVSSIPGIQEV